MPTRGAVSYPRKRTLGARAPAAGSILLSLEDPRPRTTQSGARFPQRLGVTGAGAGLQRPPADLLSIGPALPASSGSRRIAFVWRAHRRMAGMLAQFHPTADMFHPRASTEVTAGPKLVTAFLRPMTGPGVQVWRRFGRYPQNHAGDGHLASASASPHFPTQGAREAAGFWCDTLPARIRLVSR
jgi:hypothetical protein